MSRSGIVPAWASGRVELQGDFGAVSVTTGSGRIDLGRARAMHADLRTSSGRVELARCDGECRVVTRSGRVEIGWTEAAEITTSTGRVVLRHTGRADVTSATGRVEVATGDHPEVRVRTVSGRIEVVVPQGVAPATRLTSRSGQVCCECAPGHDGELEITTESGAVEVVCR